MTTLVNYWPLDEASGSSVTDTVGGLVGIVADDPDDLTIVPAKFGNGRDTGAVAGITSVQFHSGDNDSTYRLAQWSVSFWVHISDTPAENSPNIFNIGRYYSSFDYPEFTQVFVYGNKSQSQLYVDVYGGTSDIFTTHEQIGFDWHAQHHIVITGDGANVCVYLDGVKIQDVACDAELTPKHQSSMASPTGNVHAIFDDIAIWNVAMN